MSPLLVLGVLAAGAVGAVVRYVAGLAVSRTRSRLPWAVLAVNVAGSFVAGLMIGLAQAGAVSADAELVLVTGFAGGLTTFSTLSVETVQLVTEGRLRSAIASVAANLVLGILAAAGGWLVGLLSAV